MIKRSTLLPVLVLLIATPALAQKPNEKSSGLPANVKVVPMASTSAYLDALRKNTTTAGRIALAEAGGPAAIARYATIVELSGTTSRTLRKGTNSWTCIADPNGPVCADQTFMSFTSALMSHMAPNISKVAVAYMLAGDEGVSLTDPFATKPTADWVKSGAHIMVAPPDASTLNGLPTAPTAGGPYVMWKNTPYAHLMVPVR